MSQSGAYRLELSGVTKAFPGVLANDHVSFAVAPGEIHALLGENGAGKSTLVKMIYGVLQPDEGEIRFDGTPVAHPEPAGRPGDGDRHGVPALLAVRGADRAREHRARPRREARRRPSSRSASARC